MIVAAALLVFGILVFILTKDWMKASYEMGFGPGFYPRLLAAILILLAIIMFIEDRVEEKKKLRDQAAASPVEPRTTEEPTPPDTSAEIELSAEDSFLMPEDSGFEQDEIASEEEPKSVLSQFKFPAIFFGMLILYTLLLDIIGFIADTAIFLFVGMMVLKGKLLKSIIISILFTLTIYFLFGFLLKVRLPVGLIFGG